MPEAPELIVDDAARWRSWLDTHEDTSDGVWLVLAKKGTTSPTSLTYAQALDEALCSGWIDGRKQSRDAATFRQHFTPRRARSMWSKRNVDHVARLTDEGRMRPRGADEIARAHATAAGSARTRAPRRSRCRPICARRSTPSPTRRALSTP